MQNAQPRKREEGVITVVLLALLTMGFVGSAVFGFWVFSQWKQLETDFDAQVAAEKQTAVDAAVAEAEAAFAEEQKNPFRSYSGSDTFGALTFEFPKTWNVYRDGRGNTILDFYALPREIPGLDRDVNFAFRAQIVDKTYTSELAKFEGDVDNGSVTVRAFEPELVPSEAGVYLRGEIVNGKQGAMVLLPQRDKTFKFWTEAEEYIEDFDQVMKTISYSP